MKLPAFVRDLSLPPIEYHRQLRQWSAQMRDLSSPIIWDEDSACWLVFRYDDVARVQSDYHRFTSIGTVANKEAKSIIAMDPPDHTKLRSLITLAFSPRTILARASEIEAIVDELLERARPKGEMD